VSALYGFQYLLWLKLYRRPDPDNACQRAAQLIVQAIKKHFATEQRPFVLGLPTGGSPLGVYEELVRLYKAGEISFKASFVNARSPLPFTDSSPRMQNVVTFNMDEYLGLKPTHSQSYHRYMHENCKLLALYL
jgi:glucosamine-6-phosphate deaminase